MSEEERIAQALAGKTHSMAKEETNEKRCPHCRFKITNLDKVKVNKLYRCTSCKEKYLILKSPKTSFWLA